MNNDIVLLSENNNTITITCEKIPNANSYTVLGMNDYSSYEIIAKTNSNIITLERRRIAMYHNLKIDYIYDDGNKETYIGSTNSYTITSKIYEKLDVEILESYNGLAVAITNDHYYDKYMLYQKINNKYMLMYETEDFVFNSRLFNTNSTYLIEAYKKEDDKYELCAKTTDFTCNPIQLKKDFKTPTISVVIPCYNRERYISRCIDSILLSTFNKVEIIAIDDCSTDGTFNVLKWYEDHYPDYVKVHKNRVNKGVALTRNAGIEKAKGKYIAFFDSDDYIHSRMFEHLYNACSKEKLDICIGKTIIRKDINEYSICLDIKNDVDEYKVYTYDEMFINKKTPTYENIFFTSPCNKIIKANLVKKIKFPDLRVYEDTAYTRTIYSYIDRFGFAYNAYYVWDKRDGKITETISSGKTNKDKGLDFYQMFNDAVFYALKYGNMDKKEYLIYDTIAEIHRYIKGFRNQKIDDPIFAIYINELKEIDKKENVLKNKYIKSNNELYFYLLKYLRKQ